MVPWMRERNDEAVDFPSFVVLTDSAHALAREAFGAKGSAEFSCDLQRPLIRKSRPPQPS